MISKRLILIVLLILFFTGCATTGNFSFGGGNSVKEEDKSGVGLEVTINDDAKNIGLTKTIDFRIRLKNTGLKPIEMTSENLEISTNTRNPQSLSDTAFDETTVEKLKSKIFEGGSLTLEHDVNTGDEEIFATLKIDDWFYNDVSKTSLEYEFIFTYDYETEFTNSVRVNPKAKTLQIRDSGASQAAPVEVTGIKLVPTDNYDQGEYYVVYTIRDNGPSSQDSNVLLNNVEFTFNNQALTDCKFIKDAAGGSRVELPYNNLVIKKDTLEAYCRLNIGEYVDLEYLDTITSGKFTYMYTVKKEFTTSLPKNRNTNELIFS